VVAAFALLGAWAAYFAILALLRQLFAPRDARFRILPLRTETARNLFALVRALALWSAIVLPAIWGLAILGYEREDALVLLSVVHVCGLAVLATGVVYVRGGPHEFLLVAETTEGAPLRRWAALAVPAVVAVMGGLAVTKAVGYVNLGAFLARVLCLDAPIGALAVALDALLRRRLHDRSPWLRAGRIALWGAVLVLQIPVLQLRYHHWLAVLTVLGRPLFTVGESQASALSLLKVLLLVLGAYLLARLVRGFLESSEVLGRRYSQGIRYALSSLTFYAILAAGVFWAMLVGGFPLSTLTVLAGMAGIGIGFGLQDIVRNFISGIILLIERPLAVGDYVDIGGVTGRVAGISLRSTTVRTPDNIHILVPNADLISQQVTNLSHRDLTMRLRIPVGVSYGSDVDEVIRVLVGVAHDHPDVLDDPAPEAWLMGFGDSSVDFQLNAWITDPSTMIGTRVSLNLAVWHALKAAGIEIPFPQRDLHIRSFDGLQNLTGPQTTGEGAPKCGPPPPPNTAG
jgi:small-conductance mechanosensitive channel